MEETRSEYKILLGKPGRKTPVGRPRHTWRIILEWTLEKKV
jgi:hypothetical protein